LKQSLKFNLQKTIFNVLRLWRNSIFAGIFMRPWCLNFENINFSPFIMPTTSAYTDSNQAFYLKSKTKLFLNGMTK